MQYNPRLRLSLSPVFTPIFFLSNVGLREEKETSRSPF